MLLGIIMEKTGIAQGLIKLAERVVGSKPGGMGTAAIVACCFFAAISVRVLPVWLQSAALSFLPCAAKNYDPAYCGALLASGSPLAR